MENRLHISFTGEYHNSLDQKNRLNIPARFRKVLDPVNDRTFVLTRGFDQCLVLYPLKDWSQVEVQLRKLSSIRGKHRNFVRSVDGEIELRRNGLDDKHQVLGEIYKNVYLSNILGMALPGVENVPAPLESIFRPPRPSQLPYMEKEKSGEHVQHKIY